jgi:ABC-type Mn2+/Zn2+ transport system ATPase subunit
MERCSLEIKDATVAYNRVPAIHHLNLKIEGGHCVALMGPNGAGKTTLLQLAAGLTACRSPPPSWPVTA